MDWKIDLFDYDVACGGVCGFVCSEWSVCRRDEVSEGEVLLVCLTGFFFLSEVENLVWLMPLDASLRIV